jgi:tetratricopeptide (TPR) repeat protein
MSNSNNRNFNSFLSISEWYINNRNENNDDYNKSSSYSSQELKNGREIFDLIINVKSDYTFQFKNKSNNIDSSSHLGISLQIKDKSILLNDIIADLELEHLAENIPLTDNLNSLNLENITFVDNQNIILGFNKKNTSEQEQFIENKKYKKLRSNSIESRNDQVNNRNAIQLIDFENQSIDINQRKFSNSFSPNTINFSSDIISNSNFSERKSKEFCMILLKRLINEFAIHLENGLEFLTQRNAQAYPHFEIISKVYRKDNDSNRYVFSAIKHLVHKELTKCMKELIIALDINPKNDKAFLVLGLIFFKQQKFKQSISCFNKSIKLDKFNLVAYHFKAHACNKINLKKEVKECYEEILEKKIDSLEYETEEITLDSKPIDESVISRKSSRSSNSLISLSMDSFYSSYIKNLKPNRLVNYYYLKGNAHLKLGQTGDTEEHKQHSSNGIAFFNNLLSIEKNYALVHCLLGSEYYNKNEYLLAKNHYEKYVEIEGKCVPRIYYHIGSSYGRLKNNDEVLKYQDIAIKLDPYLIEAYNNKGVIQYLQNKFSHAERSFRLGFKVSPKKVTTYYNKGLRPIEINDNTEASETRNIDINKKAIINYNLSWVFEKQCKIKKAIKCLNKALKLSPNYRNAENRLNELKRDLI